jgi:hypothetical protein
MGIAVVAVLAVAGVLVVRDRDASAERVPTISSAARDDVPNPTTRPVGEPIKVSVTSDQVFRAQVPGLGHLTAPAGAFRSVGSVAIQRLTTEATTGSLVVLDGAGVDVSFAGTVLMAPVTVTFDDPAILNRQPAGSMPVVLHKPNGGPWEARTAMPKTAGGPPQLVTADFSPNLFGWIPLPNWVTTVGDSVADWATQRNDPRPCKNNAPRWSRIHRKTTLVHLCSITATDRASKALRAELQVQSNRRYFQWISIAPGADYVWVADEQDWFRTALSKVTKRDRDGAVLLPGNGWLTAGYRQPKESADKVFDAAIDHYSAAFSIGAAILGLDPRDTVQGAFLTVVQCSDKLRTFPSWASAEDFVECFIVQSLENLANPQKAFTSALNLFGEAGYAKAAEESLRKAMERLRFLGRLIKIVGIAGVIQTAFVQLPDAVSQWGEDQPGRFTLELTGSAALQCLSRVQLAKLELDAIRAAGFVPEGTHVEVRGPVICQNGWAMGTNVVWLKPGSPESDGTNPIFRWENDRWMPKKIAGTGRDEYDFCDELPPKIRKATCLGA